MTMTPSHLDTVTLSDSDREAIRECMSKVDAAPLKEDSDSEVDLNGLTGVMVKFVNDFDLWRKVNFCIRLGKQALRTD